MKKLVFEGSGRVEDPFKCPFRSGALILSSRVGGRDRTDEEGDFSFRGERGGEGGGEEEGDRPTTTNGGGGGEAWGQWPLWREGERRNEGSVALYCRCQNCQI